MTRVNVLLSDAAMGRVAAEVKVTCMHLRSLRKTLNPSRNCTRNSAVHTAGLLIRIYLTKRKHSFTYNKHET